VKETYGKEMSDMRTYRAVQIIGARDGILSQVGTGISVTLHTKFKGQTSGKMKE
jgi:hypothetical protein